MVNHINMVISKHDHFRVSSGVLISCVQFLSNGITGAKAPLAAPGLLAGTDLSGLLGIAAPGLMAGILAQG